MAKMTGGRIIAEMLKREGVETFFGIVDGTYLHLFVNCVELGLKMVSPRHETTGAHMAGAYARMTGKLGVCIASNGPGVANMLPGVAVENGEGNRVLLITSSRRTGITYPDRGGTYQYFDQVKTISGMSKWSASVAYPDRIPELLRQAFRMCYQGRPGVVHIDIPEDIINNEWDAPEFLEPHQYRRVEGIRPSGSQVQKAAEMLAKAKLPVIHGGSGVIHAGAYEELARLAEILHSPVTTSWSARGIFPEGSDLAWPMVHIEACNQVHKAADLVLCLGTPLGETDWWGKAPYWSPAKDQTFIHVDVDDSSLGRNHAAELNILADVKVFLGELIAALEPMKDSIPLESRRAAVAELAEAKNADRAALAGALEDRDAPLLTGHVADVCRKVFDDDAVAVFDGGNTAVWGNFYHRISVPNTQLGTWHFGHLGAGLGQALGAAVARPDKQVYCILGDGAMGFHCQEIETAVRNGLKVIFLVCTDKQWGMVKLTQLFALGPVADQFPNALSIAPAVNADFQEIAWDKLAESMGAHGARISSPDELEPTLRECLEAGTCSVIHVDVDAAKHLMMAPGLMYFKAMHQEPAGE